MNNFLGLLTKYLALSTIALSLHVQAAAQGLGPEDRDISRAMLGMLKDDIKNNYYDQTFHGVDLNERFAAAEAKIKTATSRDQLMAIVAQTLLDFNDSHTYFLPPSRAARVEYGWRMQMIGDDCYVVAVKTKSDAEAKGLKPGDRILSVDGFRPVRANFWKMLYRYYTLIPSRSVGLIVHTAGDDKPRQLDIMSRIQQTALVTDWGNLWTQYRSEEWDITHDRFFEAGRDLLIWNMPTFDVSKDHIDEIMGRARKFKTLVIDLRGNGGGAVETLSRLVTHFFDKEIKIADFKTRKETKPQLAKKRSGGDGPFSGRLIVLVDNNSASASELFARVMQIEKRGTVVGDNTAGAVMAAKSYDHESGVGRVLYFGASITIADLIMTDGKSLERAGVIPDEIVRPTAADLAASRDPVLSRAAEMAGVNLPAEKAGTLFPIDWKRQ